MKRTFFKFITGSIVGVSLLFSLAAQATIISPTPEYGADDGSELFTNTFDNGFAVEIFDFAESFTDGLEFGFYFANNVTGLIPIFDTADSSSTTLNSAIIDFTTGVILDNDTQTIQSLFSGTGDFGFYLGFYDANGAIDNLVYSQAALNPGGLDFAGTLPSMITPSGYLIGFEAGDSSANGQLLYLGSIFGLTPTSAVAVSAPLTFLLLLCGMSLVLVRRKAFKR